MSRSVVSVTHIIVAFLLALILEDNIHIYVQIINENSIILGVKKITLVLILPHFVHTHALTL